MNKKNKNWKLKQLLLDLLFFLVLLALDQGTKYLAVTHLKRPVISKNLAGCI